MGHRPSLGWLGCSLLALLAPNMTHAYSLGSGLTTSCHEQITFRAIQTLIASVDFGGFELPEDDLWRDVALELGRAIFDLPANGNAPPDGPILDEAQQFVVWSIIVGVRSVDVEGHSVADLTNLRLLQADPSPTGQYLHALRALDDDGFAGDLAAIEGTKATLRNTLSQVQQAQTSPQLTEVTLALDFYGEIDVPVARVPYLIGRAFHTLQDSYSHMLRSDDGTVVLHVSNYLEAIRGSLRESRDGMAHSVSFDDCGPATAPIVQRASDVTLGLALAIPSYLEGDDSLVEQGLQPCPPTATDLGTCGWITYRSECEEAIYSGDEAAMAAACCSSANAYCGTKWLAQFRDQQSKPYLEEVFGCSLHAGPGASRGTAFGSWLVLALLWSLGRKRRLARRAPLGPFGSRSLTLAFPLLSLLHAAPAQGKSQPTAEASPPESLTTLGCPLGSNAPCYFVSVEGHLSLFSDSPYSSLLNVTAGYGLTGGYRYKQWGMQVHIERNQWLPVELSNAWVPGVLNVGLGPEYRFANGFARSAVLLGVSVLMFDTALHSRGQTGVYLDLRPLGLRYRLHRNLAVVFDPISLAYVQPILDSPSIRLVEYRMVVALETLF